MNIVKTLIKLLYPKCCIMCQEPIHYKSEIPFCEECQMIWEEYLDQECAMCGMDRFECKCIPEAVLKINTVAVWGIIYTPGFEEPNSLICSIKRRYYRVTTNYFADLIVEKMLRQCEELGIDYKSYVITYCPRRLSSETKYGVDQSHKLALAIGKRLGIGVVTTLENVGRAQQKKLNRKERRINAFSSYECIEDAVKKNQNIFLVDDIMTTGATLVACATLLYKNGAKNVIPITLARDNYGYIKGD